FLRIRLRGLIRMRFRELLQPFGHGIERAQRLLVMRGLPCRMLFQLLPRQAPGRIGKGGYRLLLDLVPGDAWLVSSQRLPPCAHSLSLSDIASTSSMRASNTATRDSSARLFCSDSSSAVAAKLSSPSRQKDADPRMACTTCAAP